MIIGYARVSTNDQNLNAQLDALAEIGAERVFSETVSGANAKRLELDKLPITCDEQIVPSNDADQGHQLTALLCDKAALQQQFANILAQRCRRVSCTNTGAFFKERLKRAQHLV